MYYSEYCLDYSDLQIFLRKANKEGYQIVAVTQYERTYTVVYIIPDAVIY